MRTFSKKSFLEAQFDDVLKDTDGLPHPCNRGRSTPYVALSGLQPCSVFWQQIVKASLSVSKT